MLQITVDRLKKLRSTKEIYIITRKELHDTIASEIKGIDPKNIVIEPSGKNTAPAIGLMALKITEYEPEAIMGVFPADHLIVGHRDFENTIDQADLMAKKNSGLITIGIDPTHASTEYGYIQFEKIENKKDLSGYQQDEKFLDIVKEEPIQRIEAVEYYKTFLPDSSTYYCPLTEKAYQIDISEEGSSFKVSSPITVTVKKPRYLLFSFKANSHGIIQDGTRSWD